ncbi:MAG: Ig-like domain-containing protein [Deltaproteobacteria bacterium]|nr:Ig-like domain-containing protein [Deltaproteobacteria bacterium]
MDFLCRRAPLLFFLMTIGCGGASAPTGSSADPIPIELPGTFATIDELPRATDPIGSTLTGSLAAPAGTAKSHDSGADYLMMGSVTASTFTSSNSYAACESFKAIREGVHAAVDGDERLCTLQELFRLHPEVDIYDGAYHVVDLAYPAGIDADLDRIKIRVVRTGSAISLVEAFFCTDGGQDGFISTEIDQGSGSSATMVLKEKRLQATRDYSTVTSATIDANNHYEAKTITTQAVSLPEEGDREWTEGTLQQSETTFLYDGYVAFDYIYSGDQVHYLKNVRASASSDLVDHNVAGATYDVDLLAVADGAGHVVYQEFADEVESETDDVTQGWNGATIAVDNDATAGVAADHLAVVTGATPREAGTVPAISYAAGETWDNCATDAADVTIALAASDATAVTSACSLYDLESDWIDCREQILELSTPTVTSGGTAVSSSSGAPTTVSTTPTIAISFDKAIDRDSVTSTTVRMMRNDIEMAVELSYQFSADGKTITIAPTLTAGNTYYLEIVAGANGVTSGYATINSQANFTFYVTAQ